MSSEMAILLKQTVTRLFGDLVTEKVLSDAENGVWPEDLWAALEENGLTQPLIPEERAGVGATWRDTYVIVRAAGYFSAPVPLPETTAAGWLLSQAGIDVPEGPIGLCRATDGVVLNEEGKLTGKLHRVPWGRRINHVVFSVADRIVMASTESCRLDHGANVAGEPRDDLTFEDQSVETAVGSLPDAAEHCGALIRSAQIAGAAEKALEEAVAYADDRVQFGRPIAKFQAIQQSLAVMASETAAAGCAAELAFQAADKGDAGFEIAAAKIRNGEAGDLVAATAHQVLGAIGFTREHHLNYATRRIWSWRAEFGSASRWALKLGKATIERGSENLWSDLTVR